MTIALFIGRFQPFHNGHLSAVNQILSENEKIIIGIGSSQYHNTKDNPFTAEERKVMIKKTLDNEEIVSYEIVFIPDIHNDPKWAAHVESLCPKFDAVYTGSDHTKKCFEILGRYPIRSIQKNIDVSSTDIRRKIKEDEKWESSVPPIIAEEIERIKGVKRIKEI